MEEKDEFSDILLEKDENKASKFKKIALLVGVLVLVFLVVIIVMKIINKPDDKKDDSRLVIQPTTKQNVPQSSNSKDDTLFKQVPIIQEDSKKESFEEMVKKLKEKESKRTKEEEPKVSPIENEMETPKEVPEEKQIIKNIPTPESAVKPVPIKEIKQNKKEIKQEPKKEKVTKTKKSSPVSTKSTNSGTYIQVLASTKMSPDKKFIAKVKAKNYPYRLYKTSVKGTPYLKVLVGPYNTQKDARNALVNVKKDLNKNAFIFHVK